MHFQNCNSNYFLQCKKRPFYLMSNIVTFQLIAIKKNPTKISLKMSYLFIRSSKQTTKYFNLINLLKNNKSSISSVQNIKINKHNLKTFQNFVNNKEFNTLPPIDPIGKGILDINTFEVVCSDTIESLCDYFEELVESSTHLQNSDITYGV